MNKIVILQAYQVSKTKILYKISYFCYFLHFLSLSNKKQKIDEKLMSLCSILTFDLIFSFIDGYHFTQGSYFPEVNHAKNHFLFKIMRDDYCIASNKWFIPIGWKRKSIEYLLEKKNEVVKKAEKLFNEICLLKGEIDYVEYQKLYVKFKNLDYVSQILCHMAHAFYHYMKFFETKSSTHEDKLFERLELIDQLHASGREELCEKFYNYLGA